MSEHLVSEHLASEYPVRARSPIPVTGPVQIEAGWEVSAARSDAPLTLDRLHPAGQGARARPVERGHGQGAGRAVRPGRPGRRRADGRVRPRRVAGAGPGRHGRRGGQPPGADRGRVRAQSSSASSTSPTAGPWSGSPARRGRPPGPAVPRRPGRQHDPGRVGAALVGRGVATDLIRDDRPAVRPTCCTASARRAATCMTRCSAAGESLGIGVDGFAGHGLGESGRPRRVRRPRRVTRHGPGGG